MSGSDHKTIKCSCGAIIMNCRCPHPNKTVEVVENGCDECTSSALLRIAQKGGISPIDQD